MLCGILLVLIIFFVVLKIYAVLTTGVAKSHTCLIGKTVLITGGNRGLGYQTALGLAARGCRLIIADRDDCEETKQKIIKTTNNTNIVTKRFDLASFNSVRKFAKDIIQNESRLDILINNAGIGHTNMTYTEDNNFSIMQINHLGGFLLTHLLVELLKKTENSRVIFLSSLLAYSNNLTVKNINNIQNWKVLAYGNTKLCNIITTKILARSLKESKVTVNCVHPGIVKTEIFGFEDSSFINALVNLLTIRQIVSIYGKTPEEGAQTTLHAALSKTCENVTGKFFIDCKEFYLPPKAQDEDFCKAIFEKSEELAGLLPNEKIFKST